MYLIPVESKFKKIEIEFSAYKTLNECERNKNFLTNHGSNLTVKNNIVYKMTFDCKLYKEL